MPEGVKPERRTYDATRRQGQARANRTRVVDAARRRFLADGYAATKLATVAADADVSVETIYKTFRNKAGLLKAVFDIAVAGDDEPLPLPEREFVAEINAEPDAAAKLRRYALHLEQTMPRTAEIQLLVRATATLDPEIEGVRREMQQERLIGMTAFASHLDESGCLRSDVDADAARDILWTYNSVELYELLVLERGWTVGRYRDFVAEALIAALLPNALDGPGRRR
jgi:AcrR family transcriptional regulator